MLRLPYFSLGRFVCVGAIGLTLVGCVPAEQYAAVKMRSEQLAEQLGHSQTEIAEANARANAAETALRMRGNGDQTEQAMVANQASQIAELQKENDSWSQRYADAMGKFGSMTSGPALDVKLDSQLKKFASENPDLVEFDSGHGIVKFKSDVTFAVGDATVTPKAKEVLNRFASILTSDGANAYELMVAGHTDSKPVTNKLTMQKGHFDNWYLSSHRAIEVSKDLIAHGVSSNRMGVVGYADKRPLADNATESGRQQNRRVEVLILPTTVSASAPVASASPEPRTHRTRTPAPAPAAVPASSVMTKDGPAAAVNFNK